MARFPNVDEVIVEGRGVTAVHWELLATDASATHTIPVKSGTWVLFVGSRVTVAHDVNDGTLIIGDGDDTSGYLTNANIAKGTLPAVGAAQIQSNHRNSNDYQYGKYYTADDNIDFGWTIGTDTVGVIKGFVWMSYGPNSGVDGGTAATVVTGA